MTHSPPSSPQLIPQLAAVEPALIIFDKDGTLIDFHALWGGWVIELAQRLEAAAGRPVASRLFSAMNFDPSTGHILPGGHLAVSPVAQLQALTVDVLRAAGLSPQAVETAMAAAWHIPNPVTSVRPLVNLSKLFNALHTLGISIAIATSDDRALTEATLARLGIAPLVNALVCADDGIPIKPAPDMILTVCRSLNILPAKTVMVGDNVPDLQMGRAAGAGLTVGVLSGLGAPADLAGYADVVLSSVGDLLEPV